MRSTQVRMLSLALAGLLTGCGSNQDRYDEVGRLLERQEASATGKIEAMETRVKTLEQRGQYLEGFLAVRAAQGSGGPPVGGLPVLPAVRSGPEATPQEKPAGRYGGTLRLALVEDPPTLDPVRVEDTTSFQVAVQIMEGLVEFDEDLNLAPVLAERWELSPDRKTYTFHLRQGAKFHHGREVTAQDFVYSFARNLDPRALGVRTYLFDRIRGYPLFAALRRAGDAIKARSQGKPLPAGLEAHREVLRRTDRASVQALRHPDPDDVVALAGELEAALAAGDSVPAARARAWDAAVDGLVVSDFLKQGLRTEGKYTFVVELEVPFTPFLQNLPTANAAVVPREEVERLGERFAFEPVGAGPFRFSRWDRGVTLELEAFDGYFRGRPWLDRIRYRILPDAVTQLTEFEIGNLDQVHNIPGEKYVDVKARIEAGTLDAKLSEYPLLHVFYLGMNFHKPPFDNPLVRRAFNHAVNKKLIVQKVLKGLGVVAKGPLPPNFAAYDPSLAGYEYDPDKARELLKQAGYGPGNPLVGPKLWFNTATGSDANVQIAEVVQADLAAVGVTLGVKGMAWGSYLDQLSRCEAEFYRLAWLPSHANADGLLWTLFRTGSSSNKSCYSNPEVDRLVDAARAEGDDAKRIAMYREAQQLVVDDAAWIPIYHKTEAFLTGPRTHGVRLNARGGDAVRWRTVWLEGR